MLLYSDASRTDESTFGLLSCGCDRALGQPNRPLSLYIPPSQSSLCLLEWSKYVLALELVVSWRSTCKFGFNTVLCGAIGNWYVLL